MNRDDLVMLTVTGEVAHPMAKPNPYRVGHDGVPRVLPGTGGVVVSHRMGDPCIGLAGDHIEPGVSLRSYHSHGDDKKGANLALNTYACAGNHAVVMTGPAEGATGTVCGKHGGVNHLLLDFPRAVLMRLRNGDQIQVYACGQGLRFPEHPEVTVLNCSPRLVERWGLRSVRGRLHAPVTHLLPAAIMGSGLGRNNAVRGDYDVQMVDGALSRAHRLNHLRFGDLVAIAHADSRFGRVYRPGFVTVGVIIHGDSTVSGHGPGVMSLLTGPASRLIPMRDPKANIAGILGLRRVPPPRPRATLVRKDKAVLARGARAARLLLKGRKRIQGGA